MTKSNKLSYPTLLLIILAGEAVFILPFVLARVFRPTFLDVFDFDNVQLGACFSIYGIVALISYFFGGVVADRFRPKYLMATALILTALAGFLMATYPSYTIMKIIYAWWGFTTIFLFWSAMIKATRIWGGSKSQGKAFGFLDGGRGLVGASFGALGVFIFSLFVTDQLDDISATQQSEAFSYVIFCSSIAVIIIAVLVLLFLNVEKGDTDEPVQKKKITKEDFQILMRIPTVWLLMIIILCAYVGYKTTDIFSLYANEVMLYNEVDSAKVGTLLLFLRPIVGISIGFLADKTRCSLMIILSFIAVTIGASIMASGMIAPNTTILFILSVLIASTGVYAARSLYFAVLEEGKIPLALTGSAVGLVSVVGYTPDIFMGPILGYFLDGSPGELGHQHVFIMLAIFSLIGLIASYMFYRINRNS